MAKGGYIFGSVSLSVCEQPYSKSYERIAMKFMEGPGVVKGISDNFGGDPDLLR